MNNEQNNESLNESESSASKPQNMNPHFVALLEHIGRVIAKDMIEKAASSSNVGGTSPKKSDQ